MTKSKNPLSDLSRRNAQTLMVHGGVERTQFGETAEPIFMNSGYVYETSADAEARFIGTLPGHNYSRFTNPTFDVLQSRAALMEGAEACRAFATGMAAVTTALMAQVRAGDHVVAARALFGGCRFVCEDYLPRWGVETTLVDGRNSESFAAAIRPNTKAIFVETPTNPTLELVDLRAVADIAHAHGAILIVDNVFATSVWQKPLELGADLVTYSATKHIDGQGRAMGGLILGSKALIEGDIHTILRQTGPSISPFNAWILAKGLETLDLRVRAMTASANKIANFLAEHPKVEKLIYPYHPSHPQYELAKRQMGAGSTLVSFIPKGGKEAAFKLGDALSVILISNNLGDAKSIIAHPYTTTHQRFSDAEKAEMGIDPALLRLSVGLEHADDLIADLSYALDQI